MVSELGGLNGSFHIDDHKGNGKLLIKRLPDGKFLVANTHTQMTLNADDSFLVTESARELYPVKGPSRFNNPFRKLVADTSLSQEILKFRDDDDLPLDMDEIATGFDSENTQDRQLCWSGDKKSPNFGDPHGEKMIIVERKTRWGTKIVEVILRSGAGEGELRYLREKLVTFGLMRKPSGIFDAVIDRLYGEHDRQWKGWWQGVVDEERLQKRRESDAAYQELINELVAFPIAVSVEVDKKIYTIQKGRIYRGKSPSGPEMKAKKLFEQGQLEKIVAAAIT